MQHKQIENLPKIVVRTVVGDPQICFPFPGEPEINILVHLSDNPNNDTFVAAVLLPQSVYPCKGERNMWNVVKVENFYGNRGGVRYCFV
jgi:hypothetical protein